MIKVAHKRLAIVGVVISALALSGCAGEATSPKGAASVDPASLSCIPAPPETLPGDPDDVLSEVSGAALTALGGYPGEVFESPWRDFEPASAPPWQVGFTGNEANPANLLQQAGVQEIIDANPDLFEPEILSVTANPANDAASQIQGMRTLLQQGADLIIGSLSSPTALNSVIDDAAAAGVPVISLLGQSTSKNAVNVQPNPVQDGYYGAAELLKKMGASGSVLMVHGIPGLSIDTSIFDAGKAVFDACPDVEVVGELTGSFDPATTKTETLKFLTTHPGELNGAFNVANMAYGVISAFEQTGRPVPPVADIGANGASMAYWRDTPDYPGVAVSLQVEGTGRFGMQVGLAMLQGRGLKINETPFAPTVITADNFDEWIDASWNESSNLYAEGPEAAIPADELLSGYFDR